MRLEFVSGLSVLLQVTAAVFALRLIRISGRRVAWTLLSAAIFLMAIRRGFTLFRLFSGETPDSLDFPYEMIGLVISMFMLAGLVLIGPIFAAILRTEENLRRSEKRLRDIASSLGEGIYLMNEQGQVTFMNPEAERLLGWTEAELINKNIHDIVHNRKPDGTPLALEDCMMRGVIKTGVTYFSRDEMFIRKNGATFPVAVISAPMLEDGKIIGAISAFSDISETKRMEQKQKKLILQLENAVATIKTLHGILPVCASCKKIRDEKGDWKEIESYIGEHTDAQFSHSVCPECMKNLFPRYSG